MVGVAIVSRGGDTFADKARGRELAQALMPEGLRWFTETDISIARVGEQARPE